MRGQYIDFISSYCDSWCERCAFTTQCSAYAVRMAVAMCEGDAHEAIELAVGAPPPEDAAEERRREEFFEGLPNSEPTKEELAQFQREEDEREERIDQSPLMTRSEAISLFVHDWLGPGWNRLSDNQDSTIADALEVVARDGYFIHVKLHRALHGRDEWTHGEAFEDDPIQNDWNGSAKVALISIERSTSAWQTIFDRTQNPDARHIAEQLAHLRREVEREFPDAWKFVRPGFDTA